MPRLTNPLRYARICWNRQKCESRKRNIDFNLTFEDWYHWFLSQGIDRNIPQGNKGGDRWAMCRYNDQGSYELGNIYLATMRQNTLDAHNNGVMRYLRGGKHQNSKRIITPIGTFDSKAEATQAYQVTPNKMGEWLKKNKKEFYYADSSCS